MNAPEPAPYKPSHFEFVAFVLVVGWVLALQIYQLWCGLFG